MAQTPSPAAAHRRVAGRQGYIILPGCASTVGEISAEHPTLLSYAEDLCGLHFRPDLPLRPLSEALAKGEWVGGDSMLDPAREYFHWPEGHVYVTDRGNQGETLPVATRVRQCQGLLAVWATEDVEEGAADMIGLVPCSHQSNVPRREVIRTIIAGIWVAFFRERQQ